MKSSLIRFGLAFLICLVALIGYRIWYGAIGAYSGTVARLSAEIQTKTETQRRLNAVKGTLVEIEKEDALVRNYFVSEADAVAFIEDLEAHGRAQRVLLEVLSVSAEKVNGRPALMLSLSIEGTFDGVLRTIGTIEYAPYAISTSNLVLAKATGGEWHANLSLVADSRPPADKP